jgi:hypothetical protein
LYKDLHTHNRSKIVKHLFGGMECLFCNGVIRWTDNKKRDRWRSNLTWEKSVKRDLKDWCITKELALDRREWKLAIHMTKLWSSVPSFYWLLSSFFRCPFFVFWLSVLLSFLLFYLVFLSPFVFPFFFAQVVSSLTYPTCLGIKYLIVVVVGMTFLPFSHPFSD